MITDLLLRYGMGIVLLLGVVKALSMMLYVSESPMHVLRVALLYVGLPFVFWVVWLFPFTGGPLVFLVFLFDPRFFGGRAVMSTLYPFFVLCTLGHVIRCILSKEPVLRRKHVPLTLAGYFLIAAVCYLRDPALPTFGKGEGSGFSQYVSFFCSFLPFVFLPQMISRKTLMRLPFWVMLASALAAVFHTLLILYAEPHLQIIFISADHLAYAEQGRYSYLSRPAVLLFVSSLSVFFFSRRVSVFERPMAAVGMVAGMVGIVLTGTRSLVLAAVAAVLCVLAAKRSWWGLATGVGMLLTLLVVRVTLPTTDSEILKPVVRSINFLTREKAYTRSAWQFEDVETMQWRLRLWEAGIRSARKYPLLGRGFSARYSRRFSPYLLSLVSQRELAIENLLDTGGTHNMWLGPFVSFGIAAGILFTLFVVTRGWHLFRLAFRLRPDHDLFVTAQFLAVWLAACAALSMTTGGTVSTTLFLLLAVSVALDRHIESGGDGEEKRSKHGHGAPVNPPSNALAAADAPNDGSAGRKQ